MRDKRAVVGSLSLSLKSFVLPLNCSSSAKYEIGGLYGLGFSTPFKGSSRTGRASKMKVYPVVLIVVRLLPVWKGMIRLASGPT
jgi:hypothetical protein